jgi:hypothetical protein
MARRGSVNELCLNDNLSNSELVVYYRMPTTSERQEYLNRRQIRKGKVFVDNTIVNKADFGARIITGVREGDFERLGDNGQYLPISSDQQSEYYYPEWREWMAEHCNDILMVIAYRAFEVPVSAVLPGDKTGEDLEKN